MARRIDHDITLTADELGTVLEALSKATSENLQFANRTKRPELAHYARAEAKRFDDLSQSISKRRYSWVSNDAVTA